jgi:hypothetical protein
MRVGRTFDGLGAVSAGGSTRLLIDNREPQRSRDRVQFDNLQVTQR